MLSTNARASIGATDQKAACQPNVTSAAPPSSGPSSAPIACVPPMMPTAVRWLVPRVTSNVSAIAAGIAIADPSPVSARRRIRVWTLSVIPDRIAETRKMTLPMISMRLRPMRSLQAPANRMNAAETIGVAFTIHASCSALAWNCVEMVGSATLAIVMLSATARYVRASGRTASGNRPVRVTRSLRRFGPCARGNGRAGRCGRWPAGSCAARRRAGRCPGPMRPRSRQA